MKQLLLLLVLSSFVISLAAAASYANAPNIKVTLLSQSPDPVEPGEIVTVKFKIENNGTETSNDAIVKILPSYPFKLYGASPEKNIGKLRAASSGADAVVVEYKLKVAEDAVEANAEIELEVMVGDVGYSYTNNQLLIDVQTRDAILDINSVSSVPELIPPGGVGKVTIQVKNLADTILKDIKFSLDFNDISLAPYQSSSQKRLAQLEAGYQNTITFNIVADPDAAAGLYKIPLNITYLDGKGNEYMVNDILAVSVGQPPAVKPYIKKSTVLKANEPGIVTIEIANAGSTDIKFLELYLQPSDDYELISTSSYVYIGDLDSDDTESEEISLFIKRGIDDLHIPIMLKYNDANNRPFQQAFSLELPLYSSWKLEKFGVIEGSNTGFYLFLLIVISGGYYYYSQYYKKKKPFPIPPFIQKIIHKKKL